MHKNEYTCTSYAYTKNDNLKDENQNKRRPRQRCGLLAVRSYTKLCSPSTVFVAAVAHANKTQWENYL